MSKELIAELKAKRMRQEGEFAGRRSELDKIITILGREDAKAAFLEAVAEEQRKDVPQAIPALMSVHREILNLAEENDQNAQVEVLAGNTFKENTYRGTSAGLRMAADAVLRELQGRTS